MEAVIISIAFFGILPLTVFLLFKYRNAKHAKSMETLQALTNKGADPTPELIKSLGISPKHPHRDLRIGMILIALAASTTIFGLLSPEEEANRVFLGFASFPFLIGLVYLGLWGFITRKSDTP